MSWYDKYLSIYGKPFSEVPQSIIEQTRDGLARLQSEEPLASIVVIAYNEETHLQACLWALSEIRCKYPVEIIGVDNDSLVCDFTTPPLTSVQPNHERAGFMAARELEALMSRPSHKPRSEICHGLHLVERESTRPMPPSASLVRRARSFIHAAAARGIGVEDVARHLGVSRRLVDLRFREVEGRTVHEAIEDRRLGIAEKLLSETSWTVRRIAAESGYRNVKTFEVAFRKRTGRLPGSARQASRDRKQISLHAKRTRP